MKFFIIYFLLLHATLVSADEQVYQWVDAEGNMHFSQIPPPADVETQNIELESASTFAAEEAEEKNKKSETETIEIPELTDNMTVAQVYQRNCALARKNLQQLESGDKVAIQGDDNKIQLLKQADRSAEIERARKQAEQYCQPPPQQKTPAKKMTTPDT
ncbi:DUF4124 domain-containing protein [Candidatus Venteria ishoeyi]|uniref:DUF4124 domain-containing protein n=1 Tax=Candidatus Venteria ishoeyi TaxID=1899563 RepID=UPI0025A5357C|nr:DUF4124 domain-containing protein [Candidatus Venteria ishoeyi]MDM8546397.1 DUF4124 domain-containing protein [Candidatus Venteria ishoeyi]